MTGSVRGYIQTEDGAGVPDASVVIAGGPGPAPDIAALGDAAGRFALDGLAEGSYLLRAFGPAGETGEASVSVVDNDVSYATIVLRASGRPRRS